MFGLMLNKITYLDYLQDNQLMIMVCNQALNFRSSKERRKRQTAATLVCTPFKRQLTY